ncbi:hypothetical protein H6P81_016599 [Aristolochia fimbriata]|uniref:Uncharacterized protein n=1 Tax=Aristolochia fimbriata TaxID=158543 RepID=A0AAV7E9F3_ARIFI|nr:hypothetical protein H6P81_016599 [Aristolochia fimbriata]
MIELTPVETTKLTPAEMAELTHADGPQSECSRVSHTRIVGLFLRVFRSSIGQVHASPMARPLTHVQPRMGQRDVIQRNTPSLIGTAPWRSPNAGNPMGIRPTLRDDCGHTVPGSCTSSASKSLQEETTETHEGEGAELNSSSLAHPWLKDRDEPWCLSIARHQINRPTNRVCSLMQARVNSVVSTGVYSAVSTEVYSAVSTEVYSISTEVYSISTEIYSTISTGVYSSTRVNSVVSTRVNSTIWTGVNFAV